MPLFSRIPQEIMDTIVNKLKDDHHHQNSTTLCHGLPFVPSTGRQDPLFWSPPSLPSKQIPHWISQAEYGKSTPMDICSRTNNWQSQGYTEDRALLVVSVMDHPISWNACVGNLSLIHCNQIYSHLGALPRSTCPGSLNSLCPLYWVPHSLTSRN